MIVCPGLYLKNKFVFLSEMLSPTHQFRLPYLLYDSPRYAALVPGLRFVYDLGLQHHGLPGSYFLSQQIAHSGGEL